MKKTNEAPKAYKGTALVKQEPVEKKLTRAQQLEAASNEVVASIEKVAALLTGEHVTLPLVEACYYVVDKVWAKPIKALRDSLNASLKEHMREQATTELVLDYGGQTYRAEKDIRRFKMGNAKDMSDVKALAATLNVEWTALCHPVTSYEYDEAATVALIKEKMPKVDPATVIEKHRVTQSESLGIEKV